MTSATGTSEGRGLVTAVEFSHAQWIVGLECSPECTAETCSNFGTRTVFGRTGRQFRSAIEANAFRDDLHRNIPGLIRLAEIQHESGTGGTIA